MADFPLSDTGRAQAAALVPSLLQLGVTRVVSSPWPRARDTIAPFAVAAGLPVLEIPELRERRFADRWLPDFDGFVARIWADPDLAEPGCESGRQARDRVVDALIGLAARFPGEKVVAATHGQVLAHALDWAEPGVGYEAWRGLLFPDVRRLVVDGDRARWDRSWRLPS